MPIQPSISTSPAITEIEQHETLQSGVLYSPADAMLRQAITTTLNAPPSERADLFERLAHDIESYLAEHYPERPWTCRCYHGTDGSRIFRGGVGHSLVIDRLGRLWRARSYEDFDTTYSLTENACEINSLTPLYAQMKTYQPERVDP